MFIPYSDEIIVEVITFQLLFITFLQVMFTEAEAKVISEVHFG